MLKSFLERSPLVGRALIGLLFLWSAATKLGSPEQTRQYMSAHGMAVTGFFFFAAATVELLGGLSLVLGLHCRYSALVLAGFVMLSTVIFHSFWEHDGAERQAQLTHFSKNLGILGGLPRSWSETPLRKGRLTVPR